MNLHTLIAFLFFCFATMASAQNETTPAIQRDSTFIVDAQEQFIAIKEADIINRPDNDATATGEYVYICTGKYAKAYHSTPKCSTLGNCKGTIIRIRRSETKRQPCQKCY